MHIKQVVIRGFKTYKEQVSLAEDFHSCVNIIVGFNGSGKSNFFNAILFVISDAYGTLRADVRKSLLHEGTGPAVLTAFVEIVFDNTDRRMPLDKDEVRVRRTIGVKKDDYSLDGRGATKTEVFNLLESAGFSKSNPYYIVQQGKISELTLMSDRARLNLIKEVSGASVYDERRAESDKILDEQRVKQQKSEEVIAGIKSRIQGLEEEQRELQEYQRLERSRRCLEFELTDREWRTAQDRIDQLGAERREAEAQLHDAQRKLSHVLARVADAEHAVHKAQTERLRVVAEREDAERVRGHRYEELSRARLELQDERERADMARRNRDEAVSELERRKTEFKAVDSELAKSQPALSEANMALRDLQSNLQLCEAQRNQLVAKQGRGVQYTSLEARNKALADDIHRSEQRLVQCQDVIRECEDRLQTHEKESKSAAATAELKRKDIEKLRKSLAEKLGPELGTVNEQLEKAVERRRELVQQREQLLREKNEQERLILQNQNRIESTMPRPQRNAINEVNRWVSKEKMQSSVFGSLLQNIEVESKYCIAVESTAGNSLFNLLVKDDEVAASIVSMVRRDNLGSIVCTPMNQINARPRQYPKINGVRPLVNVISCPEWAAPAVHQVFGKTVLCSSLELCDEVSRRYGLDTITLDGDKVSGRGTLTGGYQDPSRFVRLTCALRLRQAREAISSRVQPLLEELEQRIQEGASEVEQLHRERRKLQESRGELRAKMARASEEAQEREADIVKLREAKLRQQARRDELDAAVREAELAIKAMQEERSSDRLGDLTPDEQVVLSDLTKNLRALEQELDDATQSTRKLRRSMQGQEHEQSFLERRIRELESELLRDAQQDHDEHVQERENIVARLEREHNVAVENLEASSRKLKAVDDSLASSRALHDQLKNDDKEEQEKIAKCTGKVEEVLEKIKTIVKRKGEAEDKLRGLTIVSADMGRYKQMSMAQLREQLGNTNKDLRKYEHVNKKAIDQYTTFTDQLQELERKLEEIVQSREAIEQFVKQVDERKEEILLQTFEAINKHFKEIFSDLVRGGVGKLRLLRFGEADETEDQEHVEAAKSKFRGVRVEVSFTGQSTSFLTMAQLSGGQKTVVAISLIFAIQKLEPAPFYLFDEIDAALDTQYRTAVARLIQREAKNAQMIITTFRPEIIEVANRFYRVYQKNRVSRVECVPRQEARRVIEEQTRIEKIDL